MSDVIFNVLLDGRHGVVKAHEGAGDRSERLRAWLELF